MIWWCSWIRIQGNGSKDFRGTSVYPKIQKSSWLTFCLWRCRAWLFAEGGAWQLTSDKKSACIALHKSQRCKCGSRLADDNHVRIRRQESQIAGKITRFKVSNTRNDETNLAQSSLNSASNNSRQCLLKPPRPFVDYARLQHLYKPGFHRKCPRHFRR